MRGLALRAQTRLRTSCAACRCYATGRPGSALPREQAEGSASRSEGEGTGFSSHQLGSVGVGSPSSTRDEEVELGVAPAGEEQANDQAGHRTLTPPPTSAGGVTWRPAHWAAAALTWKQPPGQVCAALGAGPGGAGPGRAGGGREEGGERG